MSKTGLAFGLFFLCGCSVKQIAVNKVGDVLAGGGTVFSGDEDVELVGEALPFSLKLMESVLSEAPEHDDLLVALSSGFTQYAYGWVQIEADAIEDEDYDRAEEMRNRAIKLYLRAKGYGIRALDARYPGFSTQLLEDEAVALNRLRSQDVEALYWTAISWAGGISLSLDNPDLVGDLAYVEVLMERALELNEAWDSGTIHSFFITYEMSKLNGEGDPVEKARTHFNRAIELSGGNMASVYLAYAEAVAVDQQDKELFISLVNQALAIDLDARPGNRTSNLLYQKRARWLLTRLDWLFL